jgi:DNA-directed RNA polymerase subunit alpha
MLDLSKIKVSKISEKDEIGVFVIEPLDPGFGHTLGNSLRRTLLSSLSGGAVTQVKIEGVRHQFSTISGISEDVIEFILNLKKIRIKISQDKPAKLKLDAKGPKVVTASDIQTPSGVEIKNPKQIIANLSDKAKISADITAENGLGYVLAEEREGSELGVIGVDAQFSPVVKVNFKVDATRVGRITNFDKLTLEIHTDGTVKPNEALKQAANILVDHFRLIYEPNAVVVETKSDDKVNRLKEEVLNTTIEELDLPVRVVNALRRGKIETVIDFINVPREKLLEIKNLGAKSISSVEEKLQAKGVTRPD